MDTATEIKTVAGESQNDIKGKILEFAWHLKKGNRADSTIQTFTYALKKLVHNGADLQKPDSVKEALTKIRLSENSKTTVIAAYTCFLRFQGKTWDPPKHYYQQKIPFIPLESELDQLIAGCSRTTAVTLQLLKETGMRIGEATRLKWTNINTENNTIILNEPEKRSNPRIFKVSSKLINMISSLRKKSDKVLGRSKVRDRQNSFRLQRKRLSYKLNNPRLNQIKFHTIRHWKGTTEYHKTKDILYVKSLLGHKSIKSTMIYINLDRAIFAPENDEFNVKVAEDLDEACKLVEVGFEYVTDMEGKKLFRKRK